MNPSFESRLKGGLFPEMPASFSDSVHRALNQTGVQPKTRKPFRFALAAIAATAAAASLLLVLISASRNAQRHEIAPDVTAGTSLSTPLPPPIWGTVIRTAAPERGFSEADLNRFAQAILSFLYEYGEPEPEELWILWANSAHLSPAADGDTPPVLVLAQSSFADADGPDLYCISAHEDGGVLWGTIGSPKYPSRVSVSMNGQFINVLYGTNAVMKAPQLDHITRCAITNGNRSEDVEFSVCLSAEEKARAFGDSAYYDPAQDAFVVQLIEPDALDRMLYLETDAENVSLNIRSGVPEIPVVTAAEAALHRQELDRLSSQPTDAVTEIETKNLTGLSDETAARYLDALSDTLRGLGKSPKRIWLEGAASFAYAENDPTDEAYLLAQYEFEGETGPELFCCKDGAILWMTEGFDPYWINTVYDPIRKQNVAFGHSYCYDNGAIAMREGRLILKDGDAVGFSAELPLGEVQSRVGQNSPYYASAREAFLCVYESGAVLETVETIAEDGHIFFPQHETAIHLQAILLEQP